MQPAIVTELKGALSWASWTELEGDFKPAELVSCAQERAPSRQCINGGEGFLPEHNQYGLPYTLFASLHAIGNHAWI
jgi:hypothetical protein